MRQLPALIVAACLATTATLASAAEISGGSTADQDTLKALSKSWGEAYVNGDLDTLMTMMHDDALLMPHNQATQRGLEAVEAYFKQRIGRPGVTFNDNLEEILINGDWAVVRGSFDLAIAGEDGATVWAHKGRYLVLYEKTADGWKMLRDMDNAAPKD